MPSLVKRAGDPAGRDRLRREAAVLDRARHPGVVGPAVLTEEIDETILAVPRLAAPSLAEAPPGDPHLARRVGAALARTVADLHEIGVAHGGLDAAHVLLDDGRPVLCGFRDGVLDPAGGVRRRDDAALATLVDLLAASATDHGDLAARRAGASLRRVAERARTAEPPLRAAELARLLAAGATRRHTAAPRPPRSTPTASPTLRRRVVAVLAIPTVVAAVVVLRPAGAGDRATSAPPDVGAPAITTTTTSSVSVTTIGAPVEDAPVVDAGGVRYAAGTAGDRVAIGDWACTGAPSALLLRPSTGEVWLFPALPFGDETVTAIALQTVPGARDVDRDAAQTPCATPAVIDGAGRRIDVEER